MPVPTYEHLRTVGGCMHPDAESMRKFSIICQRLADTFRNYRFFIGVTPPPFYIGIMVTRLKGNGYTQLTDTEYAKCKAVTEKIMSEVLAVSPKLLRVNEAELSAKFRKEMH